MDRNSSRKRNASSGNSTYPSAGRAKRRAMHPSNKYAERPPDFNQLASLYPYFGEYVSYGPNKKPRIDWTDFNATRELTRVLLDHDFGIKWWIPDGQLCPTVTNRANYIHWIDDLLSVSPAPWHSENPSQIRGVDIGTGANCIYPLLGAALHGWHFVGTDITPVALDWAKKNVQQNPQYVDYIEVRKAAIDSSEERGVEGFSGENSDVRADDSYIGSDKVSEMEAPVVVNREASNSNDAPVSECEPADGSRETGVPPNSWAGHGLDSSLSGVFEEDNTLGAADNTKCGPGVVGPPSRPQELTGVPHSAPVLWGVLKQDERFDFCMCNPPFFETVEEVGLNPRTSCGGTPDEMVCPGGEFAFITQIIEDSVRLGTRIQWYTSMVGKKVNLKALTSHLRAVGVTMLRTTEFVQGRTSRWGIAWSFSPVQKAVILPGRSIGRNKVSFMLEGINRQISAADVLQQLSKQLQACGAITTVDIRSFSLSGSVPTNLDESQPQFDLPTATRLEARTSDTCKTGSLPFQASVFQQVPGTLLIQACLRKGEGPSGTFSSLFHRVELNLKELLVKTVHQ